MFKVLSNEKKQHSKKTIRTCEENCALYNSHSNSCALFRNLDHSDPVTVIRCLEYIDRYEEDLMYELEYKSVSRLISAEKSNLDFNFGLRGKNRNEENSKYLSNQGSISISNNGLFWYINPGEEFGCWIKNNSDTRLNTVPKNYDTAVKGWVETVYKSPVPLHNHNASEDLRSRMCWYVDEDGWGQYTVLVGNGIGFITFPKPSDWK